MMGYFGGRGMMDWGSFGAFGTLAFLFWVVIFVDLVLLGFWLWKQLNKK